MKRPMPWRALLLACASLALTAFSGLAWHERYWRWRGCFNAEGRCYDSEAGVMVVQAGYLWAGLGIVALSVFLVSCAWFWRIRTRPSASPSRSPGS